MVSMPRHFGEVELVNAHLSHHFLNDQLVTHDLLHVSAVMPGRKLRILDAVFDSLRLDVTKQLVVSGESAGPR